MESLSGLCSMGSQDVRIWRVDFGTGMKGNMAARQSRNFGHRWVFYFHDVWAEARRQLDGGREVDLVRAVP